MKGVNGYVKTRSASSDCHTFELSKSQNDLVYTIGTPGKLEKVSDLYKLVPNAIAAINLGFFNFNGSSENLFTFGDAGYTAIYTKENKFILVDNKTLTPAKIAAYKASAKISPFGVGYTLIIDGKINIQKIPIKIPGKPVTYVGNPEGKEPRTMAGQLGDGSILMAVAQGRTLNNKGMTAQEQAQFMLDQGCVTAFDCDGGGSSVMVVNGKIMNVPTDGLPLKSREREVGSALVVVKKNSELDFIQSILPGAQASRLKDKVLVSLTLVQGCLESGFGKSGLAKECFNLFGIKWSEGCGFDKREWITTEYLSLKDFNALKASGKWYELIEVVKDKYHVRIKDYFRVYKCYEDSIADHGKLLTKDRYKPVIAAKDYKEACLQIRLCGYATDINYTSQLIALIERLQLNKYDV